MQIENTETLKCLVNAFAGESQARNRYTIFAKIAKEEGYEQEIENSQEIAVRQGSDIYFYWW